MSKRTRPALMASSCSSIPATYPESASDCSCSLIRFLTILACQPYEWGYLQSLLYRNLQYPRSAQWMWGVLHSLPKCPLLPQWGHMFLGCLPLVQRSSGMGECSVNKELEVEVDGEGGTSMLGRCEGSGTGTGTYTWLSRSLTMMKRGGSGRIWGQGWASSPGSPIQ